MNKEIIIERLNETVKEFINYISSLNEDLFRFKSSIDKWNSAEQIYHLSTSAKSSTLPYKLPSFMVKLLFGKATSNKRTFEELEILYNSKLNNGAKASGKYAAIDKAAEMNKEELIKQFEKTYKELISAINNSREESLDSCQIPHPLLKKITLRELSYFTIFHTTHHLKSIKLMLGNK